MQEEQNENRIIEDGDNRNLNFLSREDFFKFFPNPSEFIQHFEIIGILKRTLLLPPKIYITMRYISQIASGRKKLFNIEK